MLTQASLELLSGFGAIWGSRKPTTDVVLRWEEKARLFSFPSSTVCLVHRHLSWPRHFARDWITDLQKVKVDKSYDIRANLLKYFVGEKSTNLGRGGCTECLCQGNLGSSCLAPTSWERGLRCRPCGIGMPVSSWFFLHLAEFQRLRPLVHILFPCCHFRVFFKHGGEERPRLPDVPRERGLGRPAGSPAAALGPRRQAWHC